MTSGAQRAKAFVLRAVKFGEADLIVSFLSSTGERLSVIARGALKSKKRFSGGVLEPTHLVQIQYQSSKSGQALGTLTEANLVMGFEKLRTDYDKMDCALFVLDCIAKISQEGEGQDPSLYNILGNSLQTLETVLDYSLFRLHFILKILMQQGTLEQEPWMEIYLSHSVKDHQKLQELTPAGVGGRLAWAEGRLKEYLATGMLTN